MREEQAANELALNIATPALMALAAYSVKEYTEFFLKKSQWVKFVPVFLGALIVIYSVLKTLYLDFTLVIRNDFFFF